RRAETVAGRADDAPAAAATLTVPADEPAPAEAAEIGSSADAAYPSGAAQAEGDTTGENLIAGLPKRRRGQTLAAASATPAEAPKKKPAKPVDPSARFSAFHEAGRRKRTANDAHVSEPDDS
ncbi:hypothetical protein ACFFNX_36040, partial [Actinoallomurus acaciae]